MRKASKRQLSFSSLLEPDVPLDPRVVLIDDGLMLLIDGSRIRKYAPWVQVLQHLHRVLNAGDYATAGIKRDGTFWCR